MEHIEETTNTCNIFYIDKLNNISDDLGSVSSLLYTVGESTDTDDAVNVSDQIGYLSRALLNIKSDLDTAIEELREAKTLR